MQSSSTGNSCIVPLWQRLPPLDRHLCIRHFLPKRSRQPVKQPLRRPPALHRHCQSFRPLEDRPRNSMSRFQTYTPATKDATTSSQEPRRPYAMIRYRIEAHEKADSKAGPRVRALPFRFDYLRKVICGISASTKGNITMGSYGSSVASGE